MRRHPVVPGALLLAVVALAGCAPSAAGDPVGTASTTAPRLTVPALPPINAPSLASGTVSVLQPGAPIMVGDDLSDAGRVCLAGFHLDFPAAGGRRDGFVTAAGCGRAAEGTTVFVTKTFQPRFEQTAIGAISYLAPGDPHPANPEHPWTVPTSPLAVFESGQPRWPLPVDVKVNGAAPVARTVPAAGPVAQRRAVAAWTDSFGQVVTGRVLDPALTAELADLPAGVARVVIAADDTSRPLYPYQRGAPVTVDLDGATWNLGVVTGVDEARNWVVVDLLAPLLAALDARLVG